MKVFLLEPHKDWATSFSMGNPRFDPISIGYLGAFLQANGHRVEIMQQRRESNADLVARISSANPDILGVSSFTCDFNASLAIARALKEKNPKLKTVFGGYHATGDRSVLSHPEIDYVVRGEGEQTLLELVNAIEGSKAVDGVRGIGFRKDDQVVFTEDRDRIQNLDSLPFPLRYGLDECKLGSTMLPLPKDQVSMAQVTYSRGCYHNCSFCVSPEMWKRKIIWRSAKNMVDEIEYLQSTYGTNALFFTDLTFNADEERVTELCQEMIKRKTNIKWSPALRVTRNRDLLKLIKEAGGIRHAFGVESLDNQVLDEVHKGVKFSETLECLETANDLGIITRAYLMMGYPHESPATVAQYASRLATLPADQIRLSFLVPFPGTEFHKEMQAAGKLRTGNLDDYHTEFPVVRNGLTVAESFAARKHLLRTFYSSPAYAARTAEKARRFPELKPVYEHLAGQVAAELA